MVLRYLPELSAGVETGQRWMVDGELAVNSFVRLYWPPAGEFRARLYRAWLRLSRPQWELRAGLQNITFGSAAILRPLMWFERVDPRDPLRLVDGVVGVLGRYYSLRNATFWGWVLYGDQEARGWDVLPSAKSPEVGGRLQLAVPRGEVALSGHYRNVKAERGLTTFPTDTEGPECRVGLDAKWDVRIGLWAEGTVVRRDIPDRLLRQQYMGALGCDYTFPLGNGLHLLGETLWMSFGNSARSRTLSATTIGYPLSIVDMLSSVVMFDWQERVFYRFASWRRTLDRWQVHLMAFWNPSDRKPIYPMMPEERPESQFLGKGVQLLVVFNH
ncbi:MAG: hypothetical protein ONB07_06225 [candidate division KSB1 bacterium]|nr:hypothetical protein [candidate division KSB1 bacterium]